MALLQLTPTSGSPATIFIDENDIYRATSSGSGSLIVYSGPSAFLGDQQSVIVNESLGTLNVMSQSLIVITVGSNPVLINTANVVNIVSDGGSGSKIQYKEFGVTTYLFATQSPATLLGFYNAATNITKGATASSTYNSSSPVPPSDVLLGIINATTGGAITLTLDVATAFTAAGLTTNSSISFLVQSLGSGTVTLAANTGGVVNTSNNAGFGGNAMIVAGNTVAKFEMFCPSSNTYVLSRVY